MALGEISLGLSKKRSFDKNSLGELKRAEVVLSEEVLWKIQSAAS